MTEIQKLTHPTSPQDSSVPAQLTALFTEVAKQAGACVVPHPEEHCINIVFGAHQVEVLITQKR